MKDAVMLHHGNCRIQGFLATLETRTHLHLCHFDWTVLFLISITRRGLRLHSSTSQIKAGPESPLLAKHLSTRTQRGSKACHVQLRTARGETHTHTHPMSQCWTELTDVKFVTQPRELRPWQSDKQESELANVLWGPRLVQTASAGEAVAPGEGEWSRNIHTCKLRPGFRLKPSLCLQIWVRAL